jgi:uncharacterized membrane protein YfcA
MVLSLKMAVITVVGVFLGSFMDAIAGGGGIVTLPTYLLAGLPMHMALGTNKLSSAIGTSASAARYVKNGCADWRLGLPSVALALVGAYFGTRLQLLVPDVYLQYLLLVVLPVVAFVTLRRRQLPEEKGLIDPKKQLVLVSAASLVLGAYDGFYGPGSGTFMLLTFCYLGKMDVRTASGNLKLVTLASNLGALATSILAGQVFFALGLIGAAASLAGHYLGAGVTIKNGAKVVRPVVALVLVLLAVKIVYGLVAGT